jgi:hypothetical protein
MSVYSGFGTRQQESTYSKALYNTLFLLQLRIYKLFKGGKCRLIAGIGCYVQPYKNKRSRILHVD